MNENAYPRRFLRFWRYKLGRHCKAPWWKLWPDYV